MKMDVLFYLTGSRKQQLLFEKIVVSVVPKNQRSICRSLEELTESLLQSTAGEQICVILTEAEQDLLSLFSIRDILKRTRLILVLPDNSDTSVSLGHRFYPRFAESISNGFSNTAAVLAKMAHKQNNTELLPGNAE